MVGKGLTFGIKHIGLCIFSTSKQSLSPWFSSIRTVFLRVLYIQAGTFAAAKFPGVTFVRAVPPTEEDDEDDGLTNAAIAGIVIGVVAGIILLLLLLLLLACLW